MSRAAASTYFTTRVLVTLLFPVANFHFRLQFFCSQLNCWNLWKLGAWGFAISFATCQPGNRYMLVQGPDPLGSPRNRRR